jgi:hypothetical protein
MGWRSPSTCRVERTTFSGMAQDGKLRVPPHPLPPLKGALHPGAVRAPARVTRTSTSSTLLCERARLGLEIPPDGDGSPVTRSAGRLSWTGGHAQPRSQHVISFHHAPRVTRPLRRGHAALLQCPLRATLSECVLGRPLPSTLDAGESGPAPHRGTPSCASPRRDWGLHQGLGGVTPPHVELFASSPACRWRTTPHPSPSTPAHHALAARVDAIGAPRYGRAGPVYPALAVWPEMLGASASASWDTCPGWSRCATPGAAI